MGLDEQTLAALAARIQSGELTGAAAFDAVVAMIAHREIPKDAPMGLAAQIRDEIVLCLSHDQALCKLLYAAPTPSEGSAASRPLDPPKVAMPERPKKRRPQEREELDAERPQPSRNPAKSSRRSKPTPRREKRAAPAEDDDFSGAQRRSQMLGIVAFAGVIAAGVGFWYFTRATPCDKLVKQLCLEGSTVTCEAKDFAAALTEGGIDDAKCESTIAELEVALEGVSNESRPRAFAEALNASLGFDPRGGAVAEKKEPVIEEGPPKPVPIVAQQGTVTTLFVDRSHVYWTRSNPPAAARVRSIGGTAEILGAPADPIDVRATRDYVYWLSRAPEQNTVWVDQKRGVHEPSTIPTPEFQPQRAAFLGAEFAFIDKAGAVAVAAVAGGPIRKLAEPAVPAPTLVAGDKTTVFWAVPAPTSSIFAAARDGSTPARVLATAVADPKRLAVHGGELYWIDHAAAAISKIPVAGGTPQVVVRSKAGSVAFDDARLYWTDPAAGVVMAMPLAGGDAVTLAQEQAEADLIAVDGAAVYWNAGGTIQRVPK